MSFPLEIAAGDFAFAARHRRIVINFVADDFYRERHRQGRNLKLDCTHPAKESAACLAILPPCWTFVTDDRLSYHNARPAKARSGCQRWLEDAVMKSLKKSDCCATVPSADDSRPTASTPPTRTHP
jgi:hypothetical protein